MTSDEAANPMATFAEQMQRASDDLTARQMEWFERMLRTWGSTGAVGDLGAMSRGAAVFKTRVQSGGRLSIPDAERAALDIEEGDLVQAFVVPLRGGGADE